MKKHKYDDPSFVADKLVAVDTVLWTLIYVLFEHQPDAIKTLLNGIDHSLAGDKLPSAGARQHLQALRDAIARRAPIPPDLH